MRIAIVSPYALDIPGGVQQQVLELAERLRGRGHDAFVVGPGAGGESGAVDVGGSIGIPANGAVAPVALSPRVWGRVGRALSDVDVAHVHEPMMPLVGWAAMSRSRPLVLTFHADPSRAMRMAYRLLGPLVRRAARRAGAATVVSPTARSAVDHLRKDIEEIPNALDVQSYRPDVTRAQRQVAFLGRPDPRKGLDLLLEAWPGVHRAVPEAELVVMGGAPPVDLPAVRFLGRVDEAAKRETLAASGVFCAPNRGGESFGITVAEGMAAGCAVVASDLPAFADVLGGSGVLFPTGDVRRMRTALINVLSDTERIERLGLDASQRVARFDWDRVVDRYEDLYERALGA